MRPRVLLIGTLSVLLVGCASQETAERPAEHWCDATRMSHLVGRAPDPATLEQARQKANAERVRAVAPGMAVTLEYDARRLTLYTDEQGRIKLISCG